MRRHGLVVALVATASVVDGCQAATPGEMTGQAYRSLDARGADLTPEDAKGKGATESEELAQTFVDEGGSPAPTGAECLYAKTTYRESYRGVARFCFEGDRMVSVERNRADLAQ